MLPNENFVSFIEEKFPNWDDDAEIVSNLVLAIFAKPAALNLQELIGEDKLFFAKELLRTTIEKKDVAMEYIKPRLKN